jgi:hypothetical protein
MDSSLKRVNLLSRLRLFKDCGFSMHPKLDFYLRLAFFLPALTFLGFPDFPSAFAFPFLFSSLMVRKFFPWLRIFMTASGFTL